MSDTNVEPGAPSAKGAAEHTEPAASAHVSKPSSAVSALKQIDHTILRLNKLLANPGGLSSALSTLNYTLYILAHLQTKSPSIANFARKLIALVKSQPYTPSPITIAADGSVSGIAALAVTLSRTRSVLRLFGAFPLYAWLRSLSGGPKPGADPVLHRIATTQCISYLAYQLAENVCLLTDSGVLPTRIIETINRGNPATERVYLWAYRAWLSGISCEFLRLGREAQLEKRRRAARAQGEDKSVAEYQEADRNFDSKWWMDLLIASAWFPMALNFSKITGPNGLPGWNLGLMGICGLVAGNQRTKGLWQATLDS